MGEDKDRLREAMEEWKREMEDWKEGVKEELEEWKEELEEWRREGEEALREGESMPSMPLMPSIAPVPPVPPIASMLAGPMRRTLYAAPPSRSNVVASRIGDEELRAMDMLVEAGLFKTRSEAVAYLVSEGIKARRDMLDRVSGTLQEIRRIRGEAEEHMAKLKREVGLAQPEASRQPEPAPAPVTAPASAVAVGKTCLQCDRSLADLPQDIVVCPYCGSKLR